MPGFLGPLQQREFGSMWLQEDLEGWAPLSSSP